MGCVQSSDKNEKLQQEKSDLIDKQIKLRNNDNFSNFVILGNPGSGKTQLMKHIQTMFGHTAMKHQDQVYAELYVDEVHFNYRNHNFCPLQSSLKWIKQLEGSYSVAIFCVDVGDYDVIDKETQESSLQQALKSFEWTVDNVYFEIVLLLNKKDVFAKKIESTPLSVCFPDYQGGNNFEEAASFIEEQFKTRGESNEHRCFKDYIYWTDSTDINDIRGMMDSVVDTLLRREYAINWVF